MLGGLLQKLVDNPVNAVLNGNYIGILVWGILLGIFLHRAADNTRQMLADTAEAVTNIVRIVIRLAPIGIFGLVAGNLAESGLSVLGSYARLLTVLLGCMLAVALIINPLIVWVKTHKNPYPIVLTALRESGVTAFFTRSSAANIPVNLALCERLDLEKDTYAVSIPLGATINMGGAAITITVLTLAATHTLGINVDFPTALLLSVIAALSACGASGVAGGSLLLIPLSCSLQTARRTASREGTAENRPRATDHAPPTTRISERGHTMSTAAANKPASQPASQPAGERPASCQPACQRI